jgi:hypothetical protein
LLHVFFDSLGLAQQVRNVIFIRLDESAQQLQVLSEFFREFQVFLIAPGLAERIQLARNHAEPRLQVVIEFSQHSGESTQLGWIDNGLRHGVFPANDRSMEDLRPPLGFARKEGLRPSTVLQANSRNNGTVPKRLFVQSPVEYSFRRLSLGINTGALLRDEIHRPEDC